MNLQKKLEQIEKELQESQQELENTNATLDDKEKQFANVSRPISRQEADLVSKRGQLIII